MSPTDETPTFNMKAVVQETGLKSDTIRAWERRYGLPEPGRTEGGHRLYSQRDIDVLHWLMERREEGLSISHAVELFRQMEAEGEDPLRSSERSTPQMPAAAIESGEAVAELRQTWVTACLAFDEERAEQCLIQAFALYPPEIVCSELLQKGLADVGASWYRGEASVQQEHFTSELALRRLETLISATPSPTRAGRILLGCPPGEEHAFSALLLTFLLRRKGWEALYLGVNVPVDRLRAMLQATRPQLTVLAAQQLHTAASLLEMAQLLEREGVPIAFGGTIFNQEPELQPLIPGHFLDQDLYAAPQVIENFMRGPQPSPATETVSQTYRQALEHYQERRPQIEADIGKAIRSLDGQFSLATINANMARDLQAALRLGNITLLDSQIEWLDGLLAHHDGEQVLLEAYLEAYYRAAARHLDARGRPIVEWLAQYAPAEN